MLLINQVVTDTSSCTSLDDCPNLADSFMQAIIYGEANFSRLSTDAGGFTRFSFTVEAGVDMTCARKLVCLQKFEFAMGPLDSSCEELSITNLQDGCRIYHIETVGDL